MVQRTGFEPAKHYALGPHPSPFDHSGTSARRLSGPPFVFHDGEQRWLCYDSEFDADLLGHGRKLPRLGVVEKRRSVHRFDCGEEKDRAAYPHK